VTTLAVASSSSAEPGTLGFLVVAGMGLILVLLFRSMTKHLRKVQGRTESAGFPRPDGIVGPDVPAGGDGWVQASAVADDPGRSGTGGDDSQSL
jgi:hypothetical protein